MKFTQYFQRQNKQDIQFANKVYTLGEVPFSYLTEGERMDFDSLDDLLNFMNKRSERTIHFQDNCAQFGIIKDPTKIDLSTFDFKNMSGEDMYIFILKDDNTEKEVIVYTDDPAPDIATPSWDWGDVMIEK